MIEFSDKVDQLIPALLSVQNEFVSIKKETQGQKNKYASYDALIIKAKPALTAAGLVLLQPITFVGSTPTITTILIHSASGQFVRSHTLIKEMDDIVSSSGKSSINQVQRYGGGISYTKRYALSAMLAWATGDEDIDSAKIEADEGKNDFIVHSFEDMLAESKMNASFKKNIIDWARMDNPIDFKKSVYRHVRDIVIPKATESEETALKLFQDFIRDNI